MRYKTVNHIVNRLLWYEQDGFLWDILIVDHVYTRYVNGNIRNNTWRVAAGSDLQKCLDFIHVNIILYILLNAIDGKVYKSSKGIYKRSSSCVRVNNNSMDWFTCVTGINKGIRRRRRYSSSLLITLLGRSMTFTLISISGARTYRCCCTLTT